MNWHKFLESLHGGEIEKLKIALEYTEKNGSIPLTPEARRLRAKDVMESKDLTVTEQILVRAMPLDQVASQTIEIVRRVRERVEIECGCVPGLVDTRTFVQRQIEALHRQAW